MAKRPRSTETLTNRSTVIWWDGTVLKSATRGNYVCNTSGSEFPNYRDVIKAGGNANTPSYSTAWIEQYKMAQGTIHSSWWSGTPTVLYESTSTHEHMGGGCFPAGIPVDMVLQDQALAKVKRQIADNTKEFNSLVPLAEAKELQGLVHQTANLATTLVRGLLDLKHGKFRDAASRASDMWLGFNFGVKPLISDTKSVAESLAAFFEQPPRRQTFNGTASKTWFTSVSGSLISNTAQYSGCKCTGRLEHHLTVKYTAGCLLDIKSANDYSMGRHLGFAPESLLPAAWELVPYSWVVDYFTTAGEFLEDAFSADGNYTNYVTLSKTYTCNYTGSYELVESPIAMVGGGLSGSSMSSGYYNRTNVGSQLPRRALRIKTIDEIGLGSVNKLLNLAAVLLK